MGISRAFAALIINEHSYRPLSGRVLCIANLCVAMTPTETQELAARYGIEINADDLVLDEATRSKGRDAVDMRSFFRTVCGCEVDVMDISSYEGATILADLNDTIADELCGRYDVVVEGGTLDNIFDPANAMRNLHNLLAPGGRMFSLNVFNASIFNSSYQSLPPDWFFDFYASNQYEDLVMYFVDRGPAVRETMGVDEVIIEVKLVNRTVDAETILRLTSDKDTAIEIRRRGPEWQVFAQDQQLGSMFRCDITSGHVPIGDVVLVAEKGRHDHPMRNPVQIHYRSPQDSLQMFQNALRFTASNRPPVIKRAVEYVAGRYLFPLGPI